MRRRRIRIQRQEEEKAEQLRQRATKPAASVQTAQVAEPAGPIALNPAQMRLLEIQQYAGNQSAMRVMRSMIQRAATHEKDKDDQSALNNISEAVNTSDAVAEIQDESDVRSTFSAAVTAYKDKKYGTALIAFRELYQFQPNSHILINMAICEMRLDLFPEAQSDLEQALDMDDLDGLDRKRATAALESTRKFEETGAVGFIPLPKNVNTDNATIAKEPRALRNQILSMYRTAEGAAKSEDYDAALNAFRLANKRLPNPVTLLNIGKCYVMLQKYSEAATAFEQALRDKTLIGGPRKITEAELEAAKRFQGQALDLMGDAPPVE